jgi:hypothetical protein
MLVLAYLRKGETYSDLACGFNIGTSSTGARVATLAAAIVKQSQKSLSVLTPKG